YYYCQVYDSNTWIF
nr:immunoglobulin light chain junction region [Macaca mulatta]